MEAGTNLDRFGCPRTTLHGCVVGSLLALASVHAGCSSGEAQSGAAATGGMGGGSNDAETASGGLPAGIGGDATPSGGLPAGIGGAATPNGGTASGGTASGGTASAGSGATPSGGTASGGTASGGTASGGTASAGSGATPSGGTASGGTASGGTASAGTASAGSGATPSGGSSGVTTEEAATLISGWLDTLQWGSPTGETKAQIIDAIILTCQEFGPSPSEQWQTEYCWAHLAAGILKESSYNVESENLDTYGQRSIDGVGTATDPTVGLLQVRFSSTVHDYAVFGPLEALQRIGCDFPAALVEHANDSGWGNSEFWAVTGPTEYMSVMKSVPCNVALGAWYYYIFATGSGYGNCNNEGTGDTFAAGLLSHLNGPNGAHNTDQNSASYVSEIRQRMESFLGTTIPDPYELALAPERARYCR